MKNVTKIFKMGRWSIHNLLVFLSVNYYAVGEDKSQAGFRPFSCLSSPMVYSQQKPLYSIHQTPSEKKFYGASISIFTYLLL